MPMTYEEISQQAQLLTPEEKLRLADNLHDQVVGTIPEWKTAWLAEVRERRDAYHAGNAKAYPAEEVLARLRTR